MFDAFYEMKVFDTDRRIKLFQDVFKAEIRSNLSTSLRDFNHTFWGGRSISFAPERRYLNGKLYPHKREIDGAVIYYETHHITTHNIKAIDFFIKEVDTNRATTGTMTMLIEYGEQTFSRGIDILELATLEARRCYDV